MKKTKITIDSAKCTNPEDCKVCLRTCPLALFIMYPPDYEPDDPKEWRIDVAFTDLCTRCNDCVTACPKGAITII